MVRRTVRLACPGEPADDAPKAGLRLHRGDTAAVDAGHVVAGDADGVSPRHAVEFFELLGGGKRDAVWDRSGMTPHALAILPRVSHYDINVSPALARAVATFLDEDG